jgi:molecular chaperone DnaK
MTSTIVLKKSPYIFGIDLGTSNSAIAVYVDRGVEVIQVDGDKMCPSVVAVGKDKKMVVGKSARKRIMIEPENVVTSVKRNIGTDWHKEFPRLPDQEYSAIDLSAKILDKLKAATLEAEAGIKLRGTPTYAVICIPANFTDKQRIATKEAGQLADLDVLFLLEEPVAAAIAYGIERDRDQTILIYDLGGGTFDVSIMQVESSKNANAQFQLLAKEGIQQLGGDDFDRKIMEIAADTFKEQSGIDVFDLDKDIGISAKKLREAQQKLKEAAEQAKKELSEATEAIINIPSLIKDDSGEVHNLAELKITRAQFEESIRELLDQTKETIEKALASAKKEIEEIDRMILIGGSTRVPLVKKIVHDMFGKEPYIDQDPDTAVARGAAIYGVSLGVPTDKLDETEESREEDQLEAEISVTNIVTHHLGLEITGSKFSSILQKGLDIPPDVPLAVTKEYTTPRDDMTAIVVRVYQAIDEVESINESGVECIGEFFLEGIPAKPKGEEKIQVTFEINQENLLKVTAHSSTSSGDLEINRN